MPVCWLTVRPDVPGEAASRESLVTELAAELDWLISEALNRAVGDGRFRSQHIEVRIRQADPRDRNIADLDVCLEMLPLVDYTHPDIYYERCRVSIATALLDWLLAKKELAASLEVLKTEVRPRQSYGVRFADITSRVASGSWGGRKVGRCPLERTIYPDL